MNSVSCTQNNSDYCLEFVPGVAQYSDEIDFDGALEAWNQNKKRVGQMYMYVCGQPTSSGRPCQRRPKKGGCYCAQHQNK
tara:strand:- start:1064 stop:1303 length:240 start_codon:yes stop_codon:yes gene_type:complete